MSFRFERYGVFVHYGVGRGYIRENGMLKRGYRTLRSKSESQKLYKKGVSLSDIRYSKTIISENEIKRNPVDWLDSYISQNFRTLAQLAGEFYGDMAMRQVLNEYSRLKIDKKNE